MFLVPYPEGIAPSQRFRFEQYIQLLRNSGYQVKLHPFWNLKDWEILYLKGFQLKKFINTIMAFLRRTLILKYAFYSDWIFIHREVTPLGPPIFEWIISKVFNKKIIFDFDDAIWLPNTSKENKLIAFLKFHQKTAFISKVANKVSCGNNYLLEYALRYNKSSIYNPSTIDLNYHNAETNSKKLNQTITLGWTGSHSTLKYLELIMPVLKKLEENFEFNFLVISNADPKLNLKSYTFTKWNKTTEIEDLMKIDIGVMPLFDDQWAQGKCGFKLLQYMSLGKPSLASPVGVNKNIIENRKNGFLCKNDTEWEQNLIALLINKDLRIQMGNNAKHKVENEFSVISNKENFLNLFL